MKKLVLSIFLLSLVASMSSCRNSSYPCPGNGQMKAADLSLFDEDGNPIGDSKKKKKGNGLINKKNPKKIRRRRNY